MSPIRSLRRWSNPDYRFAHRSELPTYLEWIILGLVMLLMSGAGFGYDTVRMRQEATESIQTTARVLGCLNGKNSLGEYVEADGSRWLITCSTNEKRIQS